MLFTSTQSRRRAVWLQKRQQIKFLSVYSGVCLAQFPPEFFHLTAEPKPLHDIKQVACQDTNKKWRNDNSPEGECICHVAIIGQRYCLAVVHGKVYESKKNRNNAAGVKKNFHDASVLSTHAFYTHQAF
jgi:hypothetical protein